MLILGITGGVGSGKSKILYDLSNLYGAYIVETDKLAHTLMEPGQTVYQAVVEAFGTEILQAEEPYAIDRAKFAQIVFADKEKLAQLNALTHPAVKAWIRKDIEEKRKQDVKIYVIEAALLIQDGYKEICDEIWYIYVNEETRIKRLMKQRGYTEERCRDVYKRQEYVRANNLPYKVIIGGAVVSQNFADEIGADGYSKDANEAVKLVDKLLTDK